MPIGRTGARIAGIPASETQPGMMSPARIHRARIHLTSIHRPMTVLAVTGPAETGLGGTIPRTDYGTA